MGATKKKKGTEKDFEASVHDKHRERLRARYERDGIESLEEARMVEMLLFYSIPVKDTYMLAHALLRRFGSAYDIFRAKTEELCEIKGIGPKTADMIHTIGDIVHESVLRKTEKGDFKDENKVRFYLMWALNEGNVDDTVILYLDSKMRFVDFINYSTAKNSHINIYDDIAEHAKDGKSAVIAVAHKHPDGDTTPSYTDIVSTRSLMSRCKECNIELYEHYIVSGFTCHGIVENNIEKEK